MIPTRRLISCCLRYQALPSFARRLLTFLSLLSHLNLPFPLLYPCESRTKPEFSICKALQRRRNTEPQEARHLCKHSKEDLLCCQCMERVECIQKEDEPEWLAHLLIMNNWELDRSNLGLCAQFRTCFPLHFLFCFASFHNYWHSNVVYYNIHVLNKSRLVLDMHIHDWISYTMICIFMSCVWGFIPLAVSLICMAAVVQA